ncbi:ankyrin repeat and SAM domain-containing protein 6-like [Macadamia integrifolia]|uniref:ankyrin repeat and SAM domain-containing protein 6-like n=1 Tax=Macadamia integrifolia TaxID=60698 RepID=UPI001C4E40B6|nr:ankyrin repeat and SAM domain-containing protein 6-like [Macadamia integrifolia]
MSRPQVTITLGRSGQVVKRPGLESSRSAHVQSSGGKRSVRERLGSNADNPLNYGSQPKSKRRRRDGNKWSPSNNLVNDAPIGRNDLRFKLMRKNMSRGTRSDGEEYDMDRRKKPSRAEHSAMAATHSRQRMPAPKVNGLGRHIPPTRSADDLLRMNSLRKSYSPWTMGGLRHRSPYRNLGTSRGLSPPRNMDDRRQAPSIRPVDASRPPYMSKDNFDTSRSTGPTMYMTKTSVAPDPAKPVARHPPPSGIMQKSSYMGEEPHTTVASLLLSLGLGKYAIIFQAEEVDMTALRQMRDNDLKELGIPMGPRKKILRAVMPRSKQPPWTSRT